MPFTGTATLDFIALKRWNQLTPRTRRAIKVGAAVEGVLKVAALLDIARRPAEQIRGSKTKWAAAMLVVNSAGTLPIYYFAKGRRT